MAGGQVCFIPKIVSAPKNCIFACFATINIKKYRGPPFLVNLDLFEAPFFYSPFKKA